MENQRKQIRLPGYYYITICTENRSCIFGDVLNGKMILNDVGEIIENVLNSLPNRYKQIELDVSQIMPNHVHFVIQIVDMGGSRPDETGRSRPTPTLGWIVGIFKSECTKQIRIVGARRDAPPYARGSSKIRVWQRNYYEHIIRNEIELAIIRRYIKQNPINWNNDINHV